MWKQECYLWKHTSKIFPCFWELKKIMPLHVGAVHVPQPKYKLSETQNVYIPHPKHDILKYYSYKQFFYCRNISHAILQTWSTKTGKEHCPLPQLSTSQLYKFLTHFSQSFKMHQECLQIQVPHISFQ